MDAYSSPQLLGSQRPQSNLDTVNKTHSEAQVQILAQEMQQTTGGAQDADPSNQRKRKASRCDGTDCSPTSSPMKRCMQTQNIDIPSELQGGRLICDRSQWVSLKDENGFTLAPWVTQLLACNQSNMTGDTPEVDTPDSGKYSTSKSTSRDPSSTMCYAGQSFAGPEKDKLSSVSTEAQSDLSPSLKTRNILSPQVKTAAKLESCQPPDIDRGSGPDGSPSVNMLCQATESALGVAKLPINNHAKGSLSRDLRWNVPSKRRPNRTEAERIQEFQADLHVAEVEPYRVLCALCNKWIKLRNNSRYCSIPWKCHRDGCTRMHGVSDGEPIKASAVQKYSSQDSHVQSNTSCTQAPSSANNTNPPHVDPSVPPPSVHPSLQLRTMAHLVLSSQSKPSTVASGASPSITFESKEPRHARLREAEHRRTILESDPHTEIVEPDRILCSVCKKWVKLRLNSTYCSAPWYSHIQRCISKKKRTEAAKESMQGDDLTPPDTGDNLDKPSSSYRETYDGENTLDPCSANEHVRESYHERPLTPTIQDSFTSQVPKKRRGRPPKKKAMETKAKHGEDGMDSYESEEQ